MVEVVASEGVDWKLLDQNFAMLALRVAAYQWALAYIEVRSELKAVVKFGAR